MDNRKIGLLMLANYPLLFFVLLYVSAGAVPLSAGALLQPYSGEMPLPSIALGLLALAYPVLFLLFLYPLFRQAGNELVLFGMSETPALLGFVIGFLNHNPWASIPFFGISAGLFMYVYSRTGQMP